MEDNNKTKEQLVEELNKIRKQVTELEKSEQHKISPEFLPDGYLRVDSKGKITDCNSAFLFLTGYSREDMVNKHFTKLPTLRLKDMPRYIKIFNSARRGKFPKSIELKWIHKDETTRWGEAYFNIERKKHRISGFNIITRDTTKRKKAEEKIYKLTQFQQSILDNMDIWLNVLDDKGNIVLWNKAAEKISGYSKKDVIGHSKIWEWSYPEEKYRKEIFSQYNKIVTEFEVVENFETQLRCKNGENKIISWNSRNLSDKKGNPMGSIALGQDITERKRVEESLKNNILEIQFLAKMLNDSSQPFAVGSQDGKLLRFNPAFCHLTGYSEKELLNDISWNETLTPPEWQEYEVEILNTLLSTGEPQRFEKEYIHKEGRRIFVELLMHRKLDEDGNLECVYGFINDITERKQAEEELKHSQQELQKLAEHMQIATEQERGLIASELHDEVGQALTGLKMDIYAIKNKMSKDQKEIPGEFQSMENLLDDTIQKLRKIYSDLRPNLLEHFGVGEAMRQHSIDFQEKSGIKCIFYQDPEEIELDENRSIALFRILQGALNNIKWHALATKANIRLVEKGPNLKLTIKDNGIGIEEAKIRCSDSFGLIGMRERARYLGGELKITGIPDKGTTVMLEFPHQNKDL